MNVRIFTSDDGKNWVARIHDGKADDSPVDSRTGWEVIQFDPAMPGSIQRIAYRPSGWLANASIQELIVALREGDTVRTSWP